MEITGNHRFTKSKQEVFDLFFDPGALRVAVPGCQRLELVDGDRFELSIKVPVPAVKGEYAGAIQIVEKNVPESLRMKLDIKGTGGFVSGYANVKLSEEGPSQTLVTYDADAQVGGPAAGVGQRVLTGITRRQLQIMFEALESGRKREGLIARLRAWFMTTVLRRPAV